MSRQSEGLRTEAFVVTAPRAGGIEPWDVPPGEVTIKVEACALCQRDSGIWKGAVARDLPAVLGHEVVGILVDTEGVPPWPLGTRVAGMGNHGLARLMRVASWQVAPVEGDGSHLALVEPLACAINACRQDQSPSDSPAVVIGLGLLGQMIGALLVSDGRAVLGVDPETERRDLAEGAGIATCAPDDPTVVRHVRDAGSAYECSGNPDALWLLSSELPPGASLVLAAHHRRMQRPAGELLDRWHTRGIVIRNAVPYTADDMADCVKAAARLPIDLARYPTVVGRLAAAGQLLDQWPRGRVLRHVVLLAN